MDYRDPTLHGLFGKFLVVHYHNPEKITINTDYFGLYSLFYAEKDGNFIIISELDLTIINELAFAVKDLSLHDPTNYISLTLPKREKMSLIELKQKNKLDFSKTKELKSDILVKLANLVEKTLVKHLKIPKVNTNKATEQLETIAVLFSGGIDSTTICYLLQKHKIPFQAYVVGRKHSFDVKRAKIIAKSLDFPLEIVFIDSKITEAYLPSIERIIQTRLFRQTTTTVPTSVTLAIAITYFFGMIRIAMDGHKFVTSGIGTEELFAGFEHWNKERTIEQLSEQKLFTIYQRDLYRDQRLASHFGLEMIVPFLGLPLAQYAMTISTDVKLTAGQKKGIWRNTAENLGVPSHFCYLKNRATQYGSASQKILDKIAKKNGYTQHFNKQKFVEELYKQLIN